MNFFKYFKDEKQENIRKYSQLYEKVQASFPRFSETELLITSCVAGLMARVAYVDFHLDKSEVEKMHEILSSFQLTRQFNAEAIVQMAITHIKDMAGLENHLYVHPLNDVLSKDEKYEIIQLLFLIAASDGSVDGIESEEIRIINKGLELSSQHFLAARAQVAKYLKSLNL